MTIPMLSYPIRQARENAILRTTQWGPVSPEGDVCIAAIREVQRTNPEFNLGTVLPLDAFWASLAARKLAAVYEVVRDLAEFDIVDAFRGHYHSWGLDIDGPNPHRIIGHSTWADAECAEAAAMAADGGGCGACLDGSCPATLADASDVLYPDIYHYCDLEEPAIDDSTDSFYEGEAAIAFATDRD